MMIKTELYKGVEWPPHVRQFYSKWLAFAGLRANSRRDFDRFVALMEERMENFLIDQCADHSGLGLTREENER